MEIIMFQINIVVEKIIEPQSVAALRGLTAGKMLSLTKNNNLA